MTSVIQQIYCVLYCDGLLILGMCLYYVRSYYMLYYDLFYIQRFCYISWIYGMWNYSYTKVTIQGEWDSRFNTNFPNNKAYWSTSGNKSMFSSVPHKQNFALPSDLSSLFTSVFNLHEFFFFDKSQFRKIKSRKFLVSDIKHCPLIFVFKNR